MDTTFQQTVFALPAAAKQAWFQSLEDVRFPVSMPLAKELTQHHLSSGIRDAIQALGSDGNSLLIEGLPVDDPLCDPPEDGDRPAGKSAVSEAVHLGIVGLLGHPFSYEEEKSGRLIHE